MTIAKTATVLFIIAFLGVRASAYELDPEYRSLPSQRGFTLINPYLIDSEYQSDLLTYQIHPTDAKRMAESRLRVDTTKTTHGHFFVSAGSLSATQFDQKLRAEIISPISSSTRVRFLRTEDENHEEDSSHSVVELEQKVFSFDETKGISVAAYGEISRLKKEDDVGIALAVRDKSSETRLFFTQADFTRSERNDSADRFESGYSPYVFGLTHRRVDTDGFLEIIIRRETPVRWNDPVAAQTFAYENQVIGATWLAQHENSFWSLRSQWDAKTTSLESTSAVTRSVRRERFEFEARRADAIDASWTFEFGAQWLTRTWTDAFDRKLQHENLLPFIWLNHRTGFEFGLEATRFRSWGDSTIGSPTVRKSAEESRFNLRYRKTFTENAELRLALTFDLDRAEGGAFEGGHGQFALAF